MPSWARATLAPAPTRGNGGKPRFSGALERQAHRRPHTHGFAQVPLARARATTWGGAGEQPFEAQPASLGQAALGARRLANPTGQRQLAGPHGAGAERAL